MHVISPGSEGVNVPLESSTVPEHPEESLIILPLALSMLYSTSLRYSYLLGALRDLLLGVVAVLELSSGCIL